jgi:hypothetical protein
MEGVVDGASIRQRPNIAPCAPKYPSRLPGGFAFEDSKNNLMGSQQWYSASFALRDPLSKIRKLSTCLQFKVFDQRH